MVAVQSKSLTFEAFLAQYGDDDRARVKPSANSCD
jgi:hypothetical protein